MEKLQLDDVLFNEYSKLSSFEDKKKFLVDFYNNLVNECFTLEHAIFEDCSLTIKELSELDNILAYNEISFNICLGLFKESFKVGEDNENA